MAVLLFDLETTGLDYSKDRIIEVGAMLMTDDLKLYIGAVNEVVTGSIISKEIEDITGITQSEVDHGKPMLDVMSMLNELVSRDPISAVVAYNSEFDETMFKAELLRGDYFVAPHATALKDVPWLCAMRDVEDNYKYKCWKMSHLAIDKGIPVNPKLLHRALDDVKLMHEILLTTGETFDTLMNYHNEPWIYIQALCMEPWKDKGVSTTLAKKQGFSWEKINGVENKFPKMWVKRVKQKDVDKFMSESTIKLKEIL